MKHDIWTVRFQGLDPLTVHWDKVGFGAFFKQIEHVFLHIGSIGSVNHGISRDVDYAVVSIALLRV